MQINQMAVDIATSVAKRLVDQGSYIAGNAVSLLGNFLLMTFAFFFMIRDQEQLRRSIFSVLPFTRNHEDEICEKNRESQPIHHLGHFSYGCRPRNGRSTRVLAHRSSCTVRGSRRSRYIAHSVIGTGVVWLPATLYLLFTGNVGLAIFLSVWWLAVVVFLLDYVLRPLLMSGRAEMSMPLVFFFILGGVHLFGLFGVLYGRSSLVFSIFSSTYTTSPWSRRDRG